MNNKRIIQTSESFLVGSLLTLVGGYTDSYSYLCRGGVFANAETGNIVLLAINLARLDWKRAAYYLFPIVSFSLGVLLAELVKSGLKSGRAIHWRQITLLVEMIMLAIAAFIPQSANPLVNSAISFVCGAQVGAFPRFHDHAMATTMCTGNLRSGNQNFFKYIKTKDRHSLYVSLEYFSCIVIFITGAILGATMTGPLKDRSILVAAAILFIPFIMMFRENR